MAVALTCGASWKYNKTTNVRGRTGVGNRLLDAPCGGRLLNWLVLLFETASMG